MPPDLGSIAVVDVEAMATAQTHTKEMVREMTTMKEDAMKYTQAGLHIIPIRGDGTKAPALAEWKPYMGRPAKQEELEQWFADRHDCGLAILGGNGLEVLDFDRPGLFEEFQTQVEGSAPGLVARLPRVATPGGGAHLYYFCDVIGPSQKLARDEQGKTLIETRGEGAYVLAPPSPACCHPDGKPYLQVAGPALPDIPRITTGEREALLTATRSLDRRSPQARGKSCHADRRLAPLEERLRKGKEYVENAPLARSGNGGHNTTFAVTRYLMNDLALPDDQVRDLLDRYNERLGEADEETWSSRELDHKVESAGGDNPQFPFACQATTPSRARPNDPHHLARTFVQTRPWVFWHGRHFEHKGTKYVEVPDYEVLALLTTHIRRALDDHYRRLEDAPRPPAVSRSLVNNTLQALQAISLKRGDVPMPSMLPDGKEADLLGLANGLLDLDTCQLRPHTPDWFSLVCLPYEYDAHADCPRWRAVLGQNLEGDVERIALLQEFFGYVLMNSTDAQRFLFLVGEGANGKSVVLAGLHAMLGQDNVSTVPLEDFGRRFAMAQTLGKLANISPEVGELDRTAEGTLKAFVSGDRMTFERKGKDPFSARPTARLVLSTNNLPRFADRSDGVWRRFLLMPFTRQVPAAERVAGMDKPEFWLDAEEAAGILNWALDGLVRLRNNGMRFTEPAACRAALAEHRSDSDPCRAFLEEHYESDPQADPLPVAALYAEYKSWCEANGFKPVSSTNFGRQVRRVFRLDESRPHRAQREVARAWFGLAKRKLSV
jgi:P4 family phage/plasmid primase-like protien